MKEICYQTFSLKYSVMQECYGVRNLRIVDIAVWFIEYYRSRKGRSLESQKFKTWL